jgi:hypothetical protein
MTIEFAALSEMGLIALWGVDRFAVCYQISQN